MIKIWEEYNHDIYLESIAYESKRCNCDGGMYLYWTPCAIVGVFVPPNLVKKDTASNVAVKIGVGQSAACDPNVKDNIVDLTAVKVQEEEEPVEFNTKKHDASQLAKGIRT